MAPAKLKSIGSKVASLQEQALAERERAPVEERLARVHEELDARRAKRARSAARGRLFTGISIGAAVAAGVALYIGRPSHAPLHFTVGEEGRPGELSTWMAAPDDRAVELRFSDGTRVELRAGARARVVSLSEAGARLVLERGAMRADVVPRPGNDWSVIGGPFEIQVTGTRFDATWEPGPEALRVVMQEAKVVVRGACLREARTLAGHESATISCPAAPAEAANPRDTDARPGGGETHEDAASAPPDKGGARGEHPAETPSAAPAKRPAWRDRARQGDYKAALAAAEEEGFAGLCDRLASAELLELANVARLGGRPARALEAYEALRRRFAGTDAAAAAAFHRGQMAFDGAGAFGEAHRWFSTYLAERPGGALAAEALGRVMEAEQRMGDLARARVTAEKYLARYPAGAHAALAKSLLAP